MDRNKYQIQIPLPPKIDPSVTMMTVEEKPDVTYADVGGSKEQIEKMREVGTAGQTAIWQLCYSKAAESPLVPLMLWHSLYVPHLMDPSESHLLLPSSHAFPIALFSHICWIPRPSLQPLPLPSSLPPCTLSPAPRRWWSCPCFTPRSL